jgi:Uma2 family endonuclease
MIWQEVIDCPYLQNLPFKIELNRYGQIVMSPASNKHARIQAEVVGAFLKKKSRGRVFTECSIETSDGVKVPDVAWASAAFVKRHGDTTPFLEAPEVCIEIISPSNTAVEISDKVDLYLARGAKEVWVIDEDQKITFHTHGREMQKSELFPTFKL